MHQSLMGAAQIERAGEPEERDDRGDRRVGPAEQNRHDQRVAVRKDESPEHVGGGERDQERQRRRDAGDDQAVEQAPADEIAVRNRQQLRPIGPGDRLIEEAEIVRAA